MFSCTHPFLATAAEEGRHNFLLVMGKNAGKIVPADGVRPCFDNRFDLTFGRSALLHHGSGSDCLPMYVPRTNVGARIRHAE
jgi:hypothetical protein